MDRQYKCNFFVVAVAGMFCLLNTSIVSAQTATDLNCSDCVGPGEVAPNTVGWFSFSPSARNFLTNQANDVNGFDARVDATFGALIVATISASDGSGVAAVSCPVDSTVSSANCFCDNVGGLANFGVLFSCRVVGNGGVVGCFHEVATFNPGLPPPEGNIDVTCLSGLANDGTVVLPPIPLILSIPGEQKFIIGTSSNQKSLPPSVTISSDKDAELAAALMSMQDQALDHSTALQESKR